MRFVTSFLCAVGLAAAAAPSQCTLTIHGTGAPGTNLVFAFDGRPHTPAALVIGAATGTTTFPFPPLGVLTLGLAQPFTVVALGLTNGHGEASLAVQVPLHLPHVALFAQGVDVVVHHAPHPSLDFCVTHVVPFHVG